VGEAITPVWIVYSNRSAYLKPNIALDLARLLSLYPAPT